MLRLRPIVALAGLAVTVASGASIPYKYLEISYPNATFTQLLGINNAGMIAGYYDEDANKGFTLKLPSAFTAENYPDSAQTQVIAINAASDTAGFYVDAKDVTHGFTRIKGTFATVDAPNTAFNQILGMNNAGELAGYSSTDAGGETLQKAFVRQANGTFKYLAVPSGTTNSQATGINDAHTVCGFYVDQDDNNHGFVMPSGGALTTLDYPNSTFTQALGINNAGQIVGQYMDAAEGMHGFIYTNGVFQTIDEPMGMAGTTLVNGINDQAQIVGFYGDADGNTIGFVGTPQPAAETMIFRSVLSPGNEVPATSIQASGTADVIAHVIRDGTGQITSGTIDFLVRPTFAAATTVTGVNLHNASSGQNAPVAISSGIAMSNPRTVKAGGDNFRIAAQIRGDTATTLATLRDLVQNPAQYYVNVSTTDLPSGAIRGQLQRASYVVLMGLMSPNNEVPLPTNTAATGVSQAIAIGTRDAAGNWTSGEVYLSTTYTNLMDPAAITGFHIHSGPAGVAGPVVIPATLPANLKPDPTGTGVVGPIAIEISLTNAQQVAAFTSLFTNPGATYVNIHNTTNPSGFMRAQLHPTDSMWFPMVLDSALETKATSMPSTAPSAITVNTLRKEDGTVAAATVWFDVNYRFPGAANINGMHIHDAAEGASGAISIPMVPTYDAVFTTDGGFGNYFNWTPPVTNLSALNDLVKNPEKHYVDLHTDADAAGASRSQLAPPVPMPPDIMGAVSANLDANATTVAQGELISIFGTNLAKVATSLDGWSGNTVPSSLNGATVTIGGKTAPLIYVGQGQINAQVPFDVPVGKQDLIVNNGDGSSEAFSLSIAANAPAIFFFPEVALVRASDNTLITDGNPAHAGDMLMMLVTGLGQTTPSLTSGQIVPGGMTARTVPVTATLAGVNLSVISSLAYPLYPGIYQVGFMVPGGVIGTAPLVIQLGGVSSNTVKISVR
jgi:uncharacterized protein (TIGR03437 family)